MWAKLTAIPQQLHWRPAIAVFSCYAGPLDEAEQVLSPLRRFGTPLIDLLSPTPYADFQCALDDISYRHGWHYYWKATDLTDLTDDTIGVVAAHAYTPGSPRSYAAMFHLGGAIARVPADATAYVGRNVPHNIIIDAAWLPGGGRAARLHRNRVGAGVPDGPQAAPRGQRLRQLPGRR